MVTTAPPTLAPATLAVRDLECSYGRTRVLAGVTLEAPPYAAVTAVVGPNAAGKSTLFKCIAGLLPHRGDVLVGGRRTANMRASELSRRVTYLPQEVPVHAVLTVFEAVLLARQHAGTWRVAGEDLDRVDEMLHAVGIEALAMRYLNELSGGQRQLVSLAQALVRDAEVMLLDEPTSNLDLQRQLEVLALVREHALAGGTSAWVTLHDLNLAARFADHIVVLGTGAVHAAGPPREVMTAQMLSDVYGIHADVILHEDGVPQIHAVRSTRTASTHASAPAWAQEGPVRA